MNTVDRKDLPAWNWSYLVCYLLTGAISIACFFLLGKRGFILPDSVYWVEAAALGLLIVTMIFSMVRKSISYMWWETVLWLLSICGIWILSLSILPLPWALALSGVLTLIQYFLPRVFISNISVLYGAAGIGLLIATKFPFLALLVCAIGVVAYEYLRADNMSLATLFSEAMKVGITPGLLLPAQLKNWFAKNTIVWNPGVGKIAGLLPFIISSALLFQLAVQPFFVVLAMILPCFVAWVWGMDTKRELRSWAFLATIVFSYILFGVFRML
ncbi:MAG: hypothetical protein WCW31_02180 [Patescibacteria group bacterium]